MRTQPFSFKVMALGWLLAAIAGLLAYVAMRSFGMVTAALSAAVVSALIEEILRYAFQTRTTHGNQNNQ